MADAMLVQSHVVSFDARVFSLAAVKKAAYRYIHEFAADISISGDEIKCVLLMTERADEQRTRCIVSEFRKEALDQDLRERLRAETEPVRNLILAHAFSRTGLVANEQVPKIARRGGRARGPRLTRRRAAQRGAAPSPLSSRATASRSPVR